MKYRVTIRSTHVVEFESDGSDRDIGLQAFGVFFEETAKSYPFSGLYPTDKLTYITSSIGEVEELRPPLTVVT